MTSLQPKFTNNHIIRILHEILSFFVIFYQMSQSCFHVFSHNFNKLQRNKDLYLEHCQYFGMQTGSFFLNNPPLLAVIKSAK